MLRFNEDWLSQPLFTDWLVRVSNDETRAYCRCCAIVLRAHKTDLSTHSATAKHTKNALTGGASPAGPICVQIVSNDEDPERYDGNGNMQSDYDPLDQSGSSRSYTKRYRTVWESIPELKNWLTEFPPDISKAFCKVCDVQLRAHKHDLMIHAKSLKHKKAEEIYMAGVGEDGTHFMTASFTSDEFQGADDDGSGVIVDTKVELGEPFSINTIGAEEPDLESNGQMGEPPNFVPSIPKKASEAEVSIVRVPGRQYQHNIRSVSRKRRLGAADVIEAIERNDFTGYELLQIVKAAIPKL